MPDDLKPVYRPTSLPITPLYLTSSTGILSEIAGDEIVYLGMSMYPTFIAGDRLLFDRKSSIQRGDIIVYPEPGGSRYIIHRVVHITGDLIQTAGDNNSNPDSYSLNRKNIIGKVIRMRRLDTSSSVRGGLWGRMFFWFRVSIHHRIRNLLIYGELFYKILARGAVPGHILSPVLDIRPVVLIKDGKTEIRLFLNNHYAGMRKGADQPWCIRPPFRLFIDLNHLPEYREIIQEAEPGEVKPE